MYEPSTAGGGASPASFAQQRLWFLEQLDADGSAYAVSYSLRMRGALHTDSLRAALQEVVDRHSALRTVFRQSGGDLLQSAASRFRLDVPLVDLTVAGAPTLRDYLRTAESARFDLATGPLIRAALLRTDVDEHVLALVIHHAAVDGRSLEILREQLATGYATRLAGRAAGPDEAEPGTFTYQDYAGWQRDRVAGPQARADLDYWRTALAGVTALDLPSDRPAPDRPTNAGGYLTRELPQSLVDGLRALADAHGATLFHAVAAAVAALLSRYTGAHDVALGTTAPSRDHPAAADVIGPFANTVVLRTDLSGEPTFRAVLARTRDADLAGAPHAAVPFDLVVQALRPDRGSGRNPLFQVYVGADEFELTGARFVGLETDELPPETDAAKFDLGFGLHVRPGGAVLDIGYSADLFDRSTAERVLGHLHSLLCSAVADPDQPTASIGLLPTAEQDAILDAWNATERPYPDTSCLHTLFEDSVARTPEGIAVVCGEQSLTYRGLDERATAIARGLVRAGIVPGDIVGICLRRSLDQAATILGVLKAGACFLPLDPDYPARRVAYMVEDSGCRAVVCAPELRDLAGEQALTLTVGELTRPDVDCALPDVTPEEPAYVIYTSGSTGAPKGIVLRHRGAVNNFTDFNDRFRIGPGDALLAVSSPSFDMSVYDLLGTLAAGATTIVPEPAAVREPARWVELMSRHQVTVWHSAPALLELALDAAEAAGDPFGAVRLALLGGDWIPVTLPDRLRRAVPDCAVISLGGATEASMDSVVFEVGEVDPAWTSIPYGRPMANQRAYILDGGLQPLPVGVPGELHLAGVGLAAGYLNRPDLTARRFVRHTFANGRTERLYKTGDLARYRPDGVIELLGRLDFQVKVHGLRIETGEIEAVLRRHTAVHEAVVVPRGERGHTVLAAVIVPAEGHRPVPADLRAWLEQALPVSMVPAVILTVDKLPTTPNGKVDRRALGELAAQRAATETEGGVPSTPAELRVAAAWRKVLGMDEIGLDDNFFDLGGDSFTAVRAVFEIDRAMLVVELFKNPTVRDLALRVGSVGDPAAADILQPLRPGPGAQAPAVVCVPYGGGSAIAFRDLAEELPAEVAVYGVSLPGHDPGSLDAEPLSFDEGVRRCADEIEAKATGPVALYGHCAGTWFTIALARELEDRAVDLAAVAVGAALPSDDPEGSLQAETVTSNEEWADVLRSMGGLDGPLDWASLDHIMKIGRRDHIGSMRFQADSRAFAPEPVSAPVLCVFGDEDHTSERYRERYLDWRLWAEDVSVAGIEGGGHYFVRTHAAQLAALITGQLAEAGVVDLATAAVG